MKTLLEKKDLEFLLKSYIIDSYPLIKNFLVQLKQKPKPEDRKVTSENLKNCDSEIRRIFESNIHAEILKQARSEWIFKEGAKNPLIIENTQQENRPCQYCGKRPLTEVYYIENVFNHNILEIGNRCISSLEIKSKKEMDNIANNIKKVKRIDYLDSVYNSMKRKLDEYKYFLANLDLIIPENLLTPYAQTVQTLNGLYNHYVDHKTPNKNLKPIESEIGILLSQLPALKQAIEEYVANNQSDILCAKKKYLEDIKDRTAYEDVKKTGRIGKLSISYIVDAGFMSGLIPKLNQSLINFNAHITSVYGKRYVLEFSERKEKFYLLHDKAIYLFGEVFFNENLQDGITVNDLLQYCVIDDLQSFNTAIGWLTHPTAYDFEINLSFNEIIFYSKYNPPKINIISKNEDDELPKDSFLHNFRQFANRFMSEMVLQQEFDRKNLVEYIYNRGERVTYADYIKSRDQ